LRLAVDFSEHAHSPCLTACGRDQWLDPPRGRNAITIQWQHLLTTRRSGCSLQRWRRAQLLMTLLEPNDGWPHSRFVWTLATSFTNHQTTPSGTFHVASDGTRPLTFTLAFTPVHWHSPSRCFKPRSLRMQSSPRRCQHTTSLSIHVQGRVILVQPRRGGHGWRNAVTLSTKQSLLHF
jgi:hypothetical protein